MALNTPFVGEVLRQPDCYRTSGLDNAATVARNAGKQFFQFQHEIYSVGARSPTCKCHHLRIELAVPYADKDKAKALGARWDASRRSWHTTGESRNLESLAAWCRESERIYLTCPDEHRECAVSRGVLIGGDNRLFIPDWYWIDWRLDEKVRRLCYWLPHAHPDYRTFPSTSEAALWLMTNTGYLPVNQYLPDERQYLFNLAQPTPGPGIYVYQDKASSYFRHSEWDKC